MKKKMLFLFAASILLTGCGKDDKVCLRSHTEVTPAGIYFETRMNTGSGGSIGMDGGIGIGGGPAGSMSYGPVYKSERTVTVCDEWATPTPEG